MKLTFGEFKFMGINFSSLEISTEESFTDLLKQLLNADLPLNARAAAWDDLEQNHNFKFCQETKAGNINCPEVVDYHASTGFQPAEVLRARDGESTGGDSSKRESPNEESLSEDSLPKNEESPLGDSPLGDSLSEDSPEPDYLSLWEAYKTEVLRPIFEELKSPIDLITQKAKTKRQITSESPTLKSVTKDLNISFSHIFDEVDIKNIYLSRIIKYSALASTPASAPASETLPETIYVLNENTYLIKGQDLSKYTVISDVSLIPDKTDQYMDEYGHVGEAVYAMAEARAEARKKKAQPQLAHRTESYESFDAKILKIYQLDCSDQERKNRINNSSSLFIANGVSKEIIAEVLSKNLELYQRSKATESTQQ